MSLHSRSHSALLVDETSVGREASLREVKSVLSLSKEYPVDLNEGVPQLTLKSVLAGVLSGTLCTFLALYYGLKTGVQPSMNILGATLGYGLAAAFVKLPFFENTFTPQENAVIQTISVAVYSIASPAFGFSSGWLGLSRESYEVVGGAAFEGNFEHDTVDINWWRSLVWCLSLFAFGFFVAFPIRNYYIVKKRLFFPSGTATAYIIETLHSKGKGLDSISYLCKTFAIAFLVNMTSWCFSGINEFPIFGMKALDFGWLLDFDLGSFGIGMLLSFMTNFSMLLGAFVIYGVLQPYLEYNRNGDFPGAWFDSATQSSVYLGLYAYAMFAGLAVMIVVGVWSLVALCFTLWKEKRAEKAAAAGEDDADSASMDRRRGPGEDHLSEAWLIKRDEIFLASDFPLWVPAVGYVLFGGICVVTLHFLLDAAWYQVLVSLVIIPVFACSNIEGMGRTDWDVSSAYGKLVMFPIGAWNSGKSIIPSVAVCHTTISGCSNSAALMQDFKTGYLLGASPTIMFYAQFLGALIGCFITPSLFILLRAAYELPTADSNAFIQGRFGPIYRTLAVVATGSGFSSLPQNCLWIALGFMILSLLLISLEAALPPKYGRWIPDPSAMSIGMLVGAAVPLEFFLGGCIALYWTWWDKTTCERNRAYIASGAIAGSGVSVVMQCILSLATVDPPIAVAYSVGYEGSASIGAKIMGAVAAAISLSVLGCGAWHWWPRMRIPSATAEEQAHLREDTATEPETRTPTTDEV
eukprot:Protomagalhaensia_sp_Gyna_25__5394@NODE_698_length_2818_cov_458_944584_g545_i0_p1_GENE_NODE_698_length_2818_cov_458_944584_g545_i0NODE_698_length_2818_cov_458_944584_g545_i0_p1_ORF_typecomplete_len750_score135_12OPT/PF03169_15/1_5e86DUF202/PF02656_15/56DUF202/PF02656_15/1_1e04DUF202/PF02656_15/1_2e03DUF202/PF02656_15/0_75_NODE_698_length_2818_cov_458_944584_g545_i04282677